MHTVVWYVTHLGAHLASTLTANPTAPLTAALAGAIRAPNADHAETCDLTNSDSPSSTAVILRQNGDDLDDLVLADSPLILQSADGVRLISDERVSEMGEPSYDEVSLARNRPGGFWIASTDPDAAGQAVTGNVPAYSVMAAALLSDGASRLVERFCALDWPDLMTILAAEGPASLIERTRRAELDDRRDQHPLRYGKLRDDATAVYVTSMIRSDDSGGQPQVPRMISADGWPRPFRSSIRAPESLDMRGRDGYFLEVSFALSAAIARLRASVRAVSALPYAAQSPAFMAAVRSVRAVLASLSACCRAGFCTVG